VTEHDRRRGRTVNGDRPALRRCVAGDPDRFAAEHWGRTALLSPREERTDGDAFEDLFSLAAVDELLSRRGLRTPFIRLAKNGSVVPPARYTRPGGVGAQVGDQVADDRVLDLFADGHTVVLQGLHRLWPPVIDFATALGAELGHPVQVNAYVTPRSARGFSAHYDVHDVFVLQIAGEKRWRIHGPVLEAPLRDQPWDTRRADVEARAAEEPVIDHVLRPGDALYLPRGYLHAAEALGEVSCHLTIGVHPVTRAALVDALVAEALDSPELRSSLPLGVDVGDPDQLRDSVAETVEALARRLRDVAADAVAPRLARRSVADRRADPVAPLAQVAALDSLGADSRLRVRGHLSAAARDTDGGLEVQLPGRTVRLPLADAKAVRAVLDGSVLRVGDLPGLGPDEAVSLARRLVREGVAVIEDASPGLGGPGGSR
jgi:hypothetical protein